MPTPAELSLAITPDTLDQALAWLEDTGRQRQWPARTLFKLRLCLDEILTNLTMHGYSGAQAAEPPRVDLKLSQEGHRLTLQIADNGAAFDPTAQASRELDTTLDEAQIGGHGLRLLRHYLEDMRYERRGGWNHLELMAVLDDA